MKAAPTETRNVTTPVIQVDLRFPRQAAMKNLPHRWITMANMKTSTDHRCSELTKSPVDETCHQFGPMMARTNPVTITHSRAQIVVTPNT